MSGGLKQRTLTTLKGSWNRNGYGLERLQFGTTTRHTWGWDLRNWWKKLKNYIWI